MAATHAGPAGTKVALAPRGGSPAILRICIAALIIDASTYSFSIALSCHAERALGADYWELGMLGALSALLYSLACPVTGAISDRAGSAPLYFAGLATMAATFVWTMSARTFGGLLVDGGFMGAALALFWPPIQRQLSRLAPGDALWGALGRFNVFWAIGVGMGTVATPALYECWGPDPARRLALTLLVGLAATVLAVPVLAIRMPEGPSPRPAPGSAAVDVPRGRLFLRLAWIANFTVFFAMVGMVKVFPKISSDMAIPLAKMGGILLPLDLGKIAAFALLARLPSWHYSFRWLAAAQAAAGLALVLAGLTEAWWMFVLLFPAVGALSGLTYFSSIYYGLNLREGEGKKSGIHETILSSGVCLGPLFCGYVGERFPGHPGSVLVFGGLVILAGLALQVRLHACAGSPAAVNAEGRRSW